MEMKFELGQGSGHPNVPVYLNNEGPFYFTLDTGATATTISKSLAEKLGIEVYEGDKKFASGAGGGEIRVYSANIEKLQLGSIIIENEEIHVLDFDSAFGGTGVCLNGVIGYNHLKDYRMSVNYRTKTLGLDKANGSDGDHNLNWYDFEYVENSHLVGVPTFINNEGPFRLVLDTGSSGNVITPKAAEKLRLNNEQSIGKVRVVRQGESENQGCEQGCQGIGGFAHGYAVQLENLSVGSISLDNVTVGVIDLKVVSPRGEMVHDGIIGYPFMKDLELVLDYPNQRFAFIGHKKSN
ncbi:MAG: retroviral-like aspartic protease family protein [Candidatus Thorarchaeota archaeon]|jgi:predicted aspartyl protease